MGIPLRIVDVPPPWEGKREPGMMWRWPPGDEDDRESWWICLPNTRDDREISWRTTDRASDPPHEMWDVSGTPPVITVAPSVDVLFYGAAGERDGSYWHGHIINGELA